MTARAELPDQEWLDLPAVPESRLDEGTRARLVAGEGGPPVAPPWRTQVSAVLWWQRATREAVAQLPQSMRGLPHLPVTVGALVRYRNSPVGSYSEVFASPVLLRRPGFRLPAVSVPFIAVDSLTSVVGGRAGWHLPKSLARALWPPDAPARIETDEWSVAASVTPRGPRIPLRGTLPVLQPGPEGLSGSGHLQLSSVALRGRARPAWVEIATTGPSLPGWLTSGRHPGLAIADGSMTISAPQPAP